MVAQTQNSVTQHENLVTFTDFMTHLYRKRGPVFRPTYDNQQADAKNGYRYNVVELNEYRSS